MTRLYRSLLLVLLALCWGCGEERTPVQPTNPPTGSTPSEALTVQVAVKVDDSASREPVASASEITVESSASGASGAVTYAIDFGDGTISSGGVGRHTYVAGGSFTIRVEARDGAGRTAVATRQLAVMSLSGTLVHAGFNARTGKLEVRSFVISGQDGPAVRGVYRTTGEPDRPFTGTLSATRSLRIQVGGSNHGAEATLPDRVSEDAGTWPLLMRGDSVDGIRLDFRRAAGNPVGPPPDAVLRLGFGAPGAGMAVVDQTPMSFDAASSRGGDLSFFLEFGDGQTASARQAIHRVSLTGHLEARATIVDRFGRTDTESAPFWSLALHMWTGDRWISDDGANGLWLVFDTRNGLNYVGTAFFDRNPQAYPFTAALSGDNQIAIAIPSLGIELRGDVVLGNTERAHRMTLVQSGGAAHGKAWTLGFDDGPG